MPSATRPPLTSSSAKPPTRPGERPWRRLASSTSARAEEGSPVFRKSVDEHEQSVGRLLERGEGGLRQLQRPLVVSLLRLRAGEGDAGRSRSTGPAPGPGGRREGPARPFLEACRPARGSTGRREGGVRAGWLPGAAGRLPAAGPAGGGWRPSTEQAAARVAGSESASWACWSASWSRPSWTRAAALWRACGLCADGAAGRTRQRGGRCQEARRRSSSLRKRRPPGRGPAFLGSPRRHDYHYQ